jgi:hypothetical protein
MRCQSVAGKRDNDKRKSGQGHLRIRLEAGRIGRSQCGWSWMITPCQVQLHRGTLGQTRSTGASPNRWRSHASGSCPQTSSSRPRRCRRLTALVKAVRELQSAAPITSQVIARRFRTGFSQSHGRRRGECKSSEPRQDRHVRASIAPTCRGGSSAAGPVLSRPRSMAA